MSTIFLLGAELVSHKVFSYHQLDDVLIKNSLDIAPHAISRKNDTAAFLTDYFGPRYIKKIDISVQLALYATEALLKKASLSDASLHTMGICLGNNYAGWSYVENQMYGLYKGDQEAINPYVATAWFPAAAQGEISIRNKLFGHSKTFSHDQLSSAVAFEYAMDLLQTEKLNRVVTGGYEALTSPLIVEALQTENLISPEYPAGQASCALLLSKQSEDERHAVAKVLCFEKSSTLHDVLSAVKQQIDINQIDYCLLPPLNLHDDNKKSLLVSEVTVLLGLSLNQLSIGMPTYLFGEVCGASFALQIAVALWMFEHQMIPYDYRQNSINQKKPLRQIMVLGRDYYAEQYCVAVLQSNGDIHLGTRR